MTEKYVTPIGKKFYRAVLEEDGTWTVEISINLAFSGFVTKAKGFLKELYAERWIEQQKSGSKT